jgi:hypothetical protein
MNAMSALCQKQTHALQQLALQRQPSPGFIGGLCTEDESR